MNPQARWADALRARAIPDAILATAPESPWGFPAELFRGRAKTAAFPPVRTPTTERALEALPLAGAVLDVGVGGGATSLPLALSAGTIVGVDAQADMLGEFEEAARSAGVEPLTIEATWPKDHDRCPVADVVVSGHTIYNVEELTEFAQALTAHASARVVLEATDRHPLGWMEDLWERFHGITIPDEPAIELALDVLESIGIRPSRQDRPGRDDHSFEAKGAAVALVRKRLCLPADRDVELEAALGDRLRPRNGSWTAGPPSRRVVTLWWDTRAA